MKKNYWNYTYSILFSVILLLLIGIFINLDSNGNKIKDLAIDEPCPPQEKFLPDYEVFEEQDSTFFDYKILSQKDLELDESYQFQDIYQPKVAFIIDDLGYQKEIAERIMNLEFPVTISVLPYLAYSQYVATEAQQRNLTVLLHLPLEPHNANINPGKGAIFSTMNPAEVRNKLIADLTDLPDVDGVNNHMGSKVTENRKIMEIILQELKLRGKFFIDSKTSPNSVGYDLCKEMGIKTAYRSVFLDNEQEIDYIQGQFEELKQIAQKNGSAIAIGHPYCNTVEVLSQVGPKLKDEGIQIVELETLLH